MKEKNKGFFGWKRKKMKKVSGGTIRGMTGQKAAYSRPAESEKERGYRKALGKPSQDEQTRKMAEEANRATKKTENRKKKRSKNKGFLSALMGR